MFQASAAIVIRATRHPREPAPESDACSYGDMLMMQKTALTIAAAITAFILVLVGGVGVVVVVAVVVTSSSSS